MTPEYFNSEMRRSDLAWTDWPAIVDFLKNELVCRVAVHDMPYPYVIAQSYTFTGRSFLIHCSRFGKFAGLIEQNAQVTLVVDRPVALLKAPKGQNTSMEYYSVVARCDAVPRHNVDEVIEHQNQALNKFRPEKEYLPIEANAASQIVAIECMIVELTAKKRILADGQYSPPGQPKAPYVRFPFAEGASIRGLPETAFQKGIFEKP